MEHDEGHHEQGPYPDDDPRTVMMESLGLTFEELCKRPDGAEYAQRWLDGRVWFACSVLGIDVRDTTLEPPPA